MSIATKFWSVFSRSVAIAFLCLTLAACATAPSDDDSGFGYQQPYDPIEPVNRGIWEFNLFVDKAIVRPVASVYDLLPGGIKDGVRNFLRNLRTPIILANNLLQGDVDGAIDTTGRFMTNTIIGLGGVFDVAYGNGNGIEFRDEDFGQTLAVWGMGDGAYLMLPLLGPSNVRDALGMVPDYFLDPVNWWAMNTDSNTPDYVGYGTLGLRVVDTRSRTVQQLEDLEATSLDFYATVRSLYKQTRTSQIENSGGSIPTGEPAANFDLDLDTIGDSAGLPQ